MNQNMFEAAFIQAAVQRVLSAGERRSRNCWYSQLTEVTLISGYFKPLSFGSIGRATMINRCVLLVYGQHVTSVRRSSVVG